MQMAEQFDISTLAWVKGEIDETLKQARMAFERYVEEPDEKDQLDTCIDFIHQVAGTLEMVELLGAALFAGEVERFALALKEADFENEEAGFELLMRAILQLPDYLESLLDGKSDNPVALVPLLNEMRQTRGESALDSAQFFRPNLSVNAPARTTETPPSVSARAAAKKLHRYYLNALAKLLKGNDVETSLKTAATVIDKLFAVATDEQLRRLLWICQAYFEALRDGSIELDKQSKPLLGKIEQKLRLLATRGEEGLSDESTRELMQALLYRIALSSAHGAVAASVRLAFDLERFMPGATPGLGGLNSELKQAVSADLMEELTRIKDTFDIFVRSDRKHPENLEEIAVSMTNVAETLSLLQEESLRQSLLEQVDVIRRMVGGEAATDDDVLMGVAGAVLAVESALSDWGSSAPVVKADASEEQVADTENSPQAIAEHQRVTRQVMKESKDDLIRVREGLNNYLDNPVDKSLLQPLPPMLHNIIGSLTMLSYKRVAQILVSARAFIERELIGADSVPEQGMLDALADAVMSVEYYLEAFVQSRVHPSSVLDVAERAVEVLGYPIGTVQEADLPQEEETPEVEGIEVVEADDETLGGELESEPQLAEEPLPKDKEAVDELSIEPLEEPLATAEEQSHPGEPEPVTEVVESEPAAVENPPTRPSGSVEVDDEILEIFIEEAEEELGNISEMLPAWRKDISDTESLKTLRRSFHTLKGSGRLVGALDLGEFAWAYENMLNRVLDGTLAPSETVFDLLEQAHEVLPELVEQFSSGKAPESDVEMLREMAFEIVEPGGMKLPESATPQAVKAEAAQTQPAEAAMEAPQETAEPEAPAAADELFPELDPVLLDIYSKEAEGHLDEIAQFTASWHEGGSHKVSEPLIRALHTLQGSSRMAGVVSVANVCASLEKYAKTLQAHHQGVDEKGIEALEVGHGYVKAVIDHLVDGGAGTPPQSANAKSLADAVYAEVQHLEQAANAQPEAGLAQKHELEQAPQSAAQEPAATTEGETPDAEVGEPETFELSETAVADSATEVAEEETVTGAAAHEETAREETTGEPGHKIDWSRLDYAVPGKGAASPVAEASQDEESAESETVEQVNELAADDISFVLEETTSAPEEPLRPEPAISEASTEPVQQAPAETAAAPAPSTFVPEEEYDQELLDIFLDEGSEILDASEETLQAWVDNPGDRSLVEALQRQLHTLKGGARMAGITPVGDLSHSLESAFESIVDGTLQRTPQMMDLLQLAHDRLVTMLDQVRNHEPVIGGEDLISQVKIVASGGTLESVAPAAPTPQQPAPAAQQAVAAEHPAEAETDTAPREEEPTPRPSPVLPTSAATAHGLEAVEAAIAELELSHSTWLRDIDDQAAFEQLLNSATSLSINSGESGLEELLLIAVAVEKLFEGIRDGHVPASKKASDMVSLAMDRMHLIIKQSRQGQPLDSGGFVIADIEELIRGSIAEEEAVSPEQVQAETVDEAAAARRDKEAAKKKVAAAEGDHKRRGARIQHEMVRVRADLLDNLVNFAGEVSIYRSRVEQQIGSFRGNFDEMDQTVERLREQVRQVEIENEAQIESRKEEAQKQGYEDFDPLEFDRFTHMQQLSRSMAESLNDLMSIEEILSGLTRETETLLLQQARVNTELQESLVHTRMVPLVENAPRLRRIVRQTAAEVGKRTSLNFEGAEVEMDRNVVERMMAPLEHMLRNSIAHGIEAPEQRRKAGKADEGKITIALSREGSEVVIRVRDDGAGINVEAVRKKAIERGLMKPDAKLGDKEAVRFILESGFSTAEALSQIAGRGVGMDVVNSEIKQLGGVMDIDTVPGQGTTFTVRIPLTLSVSRALLVQVGEQIYAIPLLSISGIERIESGELERLLSSDNPTFTWVGEEYDLMHLTNVLGAGQGIISSELANQPLLLARSGDNRIAFAVDSLIGSREIVVKSLGPQLSTLQDLAGATILADGSVALIIDMPALIRRGVAQKSRGDLEGLVAAAEVELEPLVMVVDDSITVRKVTERLLKRHNMRCITAKDGVDALAVLEENIPDVMLLDIEMPRMDGFELATHIRNSDRLNGIPIIMITSRTGDKHRQRALDIGVNIYMGKPYTEVDLLENIGKLIGKE